MHKCAAGLRIIIDVRFAAVYVFVDLAAVSVLVYLATLISLAPYYLRFVLWPLYWVRFGLPGNFFHRRLLTDRWRVATWPLVSG